MHPLFERLMRNAARLTQGGDVRTATAAIQAALRGQPAPEATHRDGAEARVAGDADERLITGSHTAVTLTRDYMLYLPLRGAKQPAKQSAKQAAKQAATQGLPLVVMLHGCTQSPTDFAAGTRMNEAAREQGFAVLYPAQSQAANAQRCWNWFKHNHQQRSRGEPAFLASLVAAVVAEHGLDAQRVFVAGLSAGGAMAAILGQTHPEVFAAVGVHSGLPAGAAQDLPSALAAMKGGAAVASAASQHGTGQAQGVPTIVFHGDADATVHPRNGDQTRQAVAGATAAEQQRQRHPGGREATCSIYRDAQGRVLAEQWLVHGAGHAWAGGSAKGSYTDPTGPDATREMLRFFFAQGATPAP